MPDRRFAALAVGLSLIAVPARAHSPVPGIEGFYVGLVHPLTSPAQILALLAVGVFFGQRRDARPWLPVAVFACVCLAGVLAGLSGVTFDAAGPGLLLLALLVATLAALWPLTPALPGLAAAGVAGLLTGLESIPDPGPVRATAITLSGTYIGAVVLLLYCIGGLMWVLDNARWSWVPVAFRVAAAWVAAVAALLLALHFTAAGQAG